MAAKKKRASSSEEEKTILPVLNIRGILREKGLFEQLVDGEGLNARCKKAVLEWCEAKVEGYVAGKRGRRGEAMTDEAVQATTKAVKAAFKAFGKEEAVPLQALAGVYVTQDGAVKGEDFGSTLKHLRVVGRDTRNTVYHLQSNGPNTYVALGEAAA